MRKTISAILLFLLPAISFSQIEIRNEYTATRITNPPKIDAVLDDSCWSNLPVATDFIQSEPNPGMPSKQKTEVKVAYDNNAIYISAMMYDSAPDSILSELSKRDNVFFGPNADGFGIVIDAYSDGQNGLFFGVTTAGVQADSKISDPEDFDDSWNVSWESKVRITEEGWCAEIKIPYSAIRFPKKEVQEWRINFARQIKRYNEFSNWHPVKPEIRGFIRQSGILKGISNIDAPVRLSLTPYITAYADNYAGKNSYILNGGADVKYGINESFTLDMTLIPDFGQVRSDDKILNLTPFEVNYDEQRSFFTEGTELFNRAYIFYSRRIGGTPLGYESVYDAILPDEKITDNPSSVQLYNTTKISGRTKGNLGIGFLNATNGAAFATITDTVTGKTRNILTQPLTNYNVIVFDQILKNNSYISFINTNVMREGSIYDANVTGTQFKFADKKNKFAFTGAGSVSQLFFTGSAKPFLGHRYRAGFGKIGGSYTNELFYREVSGTYNNNDLGYIDRTNDAAIIFNQSYRIFKPFWIINKISNNLGIDYIMRYNPRSHTLFVVDGSAKIDFKNFFRWEFDWTVHPFTNYDYYEPRVEGRYYTAPADYSIETYFSTDLRKNFYIEGSIGRGIFNERSKHGINWMLNQRYRFSDRFNMSYTYESLNMLESAGWADNVNDTVIFGFRNINTRINTLTTNYIFTNTMSLSLRLRHYWSKVEYKEYFALNDQGGLSAVSYNQDNNINFNVFNIDMVYTWQFLPASEMSIVWKNAIFTSESELIKNYYDNLSNTLNSPKMNSFSIRILYYIDYRSLKKKNT